MHPRTNIDDKPQTLVGVSFDDTFRAQEFLTAASGLDILCHALESWTARPYDSFPRKRADQRVPYCGANPVADMWSEKAMTLLASAFRRAYRDGDDRQARLEMSMAATFAGLGFGNAGVGMVRGHGEKIVRDNE